MRHRSAVDLRPNTSGNSYGLLRGFRMATKLVEMG